MTKKAVVLDRAVEVLGSLEKAEDWMDHMSATLEDKPINLLETDEGRMKVMLHLADIARHSVTDL